MCAHVVVIVLQLLVASSSLWLQSNWVKKNLSKIISLTHFLITFNLIYCFSHFVFFQWRSVKYITWCWWWLSSCCSSSISCVLKTTFLGITTKINRSIPWMMIAPLFSWRVFCNSITTTTTTTTNTTTGILTRTNPYTRSSNPCTCLYYFSLLTLLHVIVALLGPPQ